MTVDPQPPNASKVALRRLFRFMSRGRFVASRPELLGAGFSSSRIRNWVRHGRLVLLLRGVYSFGRDICTREQALRAALLAAGPGSVLVGRSACEQWGIVRRSDRVPAYIEVGVTTGEARRLRGTSPALRHTTINVVRRQIRPDDIRQVNGLPVTSANLALIDFAGKASRKEVRFAFLEASRLGLIRKRDMDRLRQAMAGRRGVEKLKPMIDLMMDVSE